MPNLENYGSFSPDLRESALALNLDAFDSVVRGGALSSRGMPKFEDFNEEELGAIYMYIRQRAREVKQKVP